ncbi:hypothetical protein TNCV_17511 [Trichonephila clavipes]|nr:hypothetical protein TNCV_17511 [Trichonephila clavipes]
MGENGRKRTSGSNGSSIGLRQQQYKKKRIQERRKGCFSQTGSNKEDQARTPSGVEETSQGEPVPDLQEDQCKLRRDQSGPEETNSKDQARTTSDIVNSPDKKVVRSLRRV